VIGVANAQVAVLGGLRLWPLQRLSVSNPLRTKAHRVIRPRSTAMIAESAVT